MGERVAVYFRSPCPHVVFVIYPRLPNVQAVSCLLLSYEVVVK